MCKECGRVPHVGACPEAPEAPVACYCDRCSEPVRAGEEYWIAADGHIVCCVCTDDMLQREIMSYFGFSRREAEWE